MARTAAKNAMLVVYCFWCTMIAVHLAATTDGGHGTLATRVGDTGTDGPSVARSKRWSTTFGATSGNKNATANNGNQECISDSNCLETPYTSCALDPIYKKNRCLCADGKQPLNGECAKKPKGPLFVPALRTHCETDLECFPNAKCMSNTTTTNTRLKTCTCKEGFTEEKDGCNYADLLTFSYTALFVSVFTSWICNERRA